MKALFSSVVIFLAASTSLASGVYRCPIISGDLAGADAVTIIEDCRDSLTMKITGRGETLATKVVKYDFQNSNPEVMMFKSDDRKTFVSVEKDYVGLKVQVSDMNYIVRSNYCQQVGW
ncbi:hypothetical protein B9G69_012365 [Bdellovibrio sp. SKB1291214]|uniref:hypothetical protein n=1 Tax=Bdellovibrio sp. SKB1291214 TaxID=1732569 RepID=UPI000B51B6E7|nr:hypothetical protein [Bdellovibrio sp. SKB1291214]UYL07840.1 hypothetical protein B9G69_012365 [Bdellovibrio sp. SKB1291214]